MFSDTCPFYLKVSIASMHIGSTICALYHNTETAAPSAGSAAAADRTLTDIFLQYIFYLSNPVLRPILYTAHTYGNSYAAHTYNNNSLLLFYCSLPLVVACGTITSALLPSVFVVKQARLAVPRIVACFGFACLCSQACSWLTSSTPVHVEFQIRGLVCAFQLHAAVHLTYHCMRESSFRSLPVYLAGISVIHVLCVFLPMAVWTTLARSPQDALITHALVAFCPEVLGTVFDAGLKIVRKVLDP